MKTLIAFGLFCLLFFASAPAQTPDKGASSVSGRVTLDGKPAAQVQVSLFLYREVFDAKPPQTNTFTDQEGRYAFANLPPGRYDVAVRAPASVLANPSSDAYYSPLPARRVTLNDKDERAGVDLELISGGVITGHLTDAGGRILAGVEVSLFHLDEQGKRREFSSRLLLRKSDDRGVYRLFGLPAGRYVVCLNASFNKRQGILPVTCAPNAGESDEPTVYELKPGQEIANADIRALPPQKTYTARGRAFEAATGRPTVIGLSVKGNSLRSDSNGEFVISELLPGNYQINVGGVAFDQDLTGEPVSFTITDADVKNLEIPLRPGLALQGELIIENTSRALSPLLSSLVIGALMQQPEGGSVGYFVGATLDANGRFRVGGLQKKVTELSAYSKDRRRWPGFYFLRLERNGAPIENRLDLTAGKSITGLRLVYGLGTGIIRGKITIMNGKLPENAQPYLFGSSLTNKNIHLPFTYANTNLEFETKNLLPGDYEIAVEGFGIRVINGKRGYYTKEFRVSVTNDNITELNITLDLAKDYVEFPN